MMSKSLVLMADEAFATGKLPEGYDVIAGYLRSKADYHTWTPQDWASFGRRKKVPLAVANILTNPKSDPADDAIATLHDLYYLKVPKGSVVPVDIETLVNPGYVTRYQDVLLWGDYIPWLYGSASTVFRNPVPSIGGYWVADYAGIGPFMYPHAQVVATQYESGSQFDSSTVKLWQYLYRIKTW